MPQSLETLITAAWRRHSIFNRSFYLHQNHYNETGNSVKASVASALANSINSAQSESGSNCTTKRLLDLSKLLIDWLCINIVQREKSFWLSALFLHVLNTIASSFLRIAYDSIHVLAKHFGDSYLVAVMHWLA